LRPLRLLSTCQVVMLAALAVGEDGAVGEPEVPLVALDPHPATERARGSTSAEQRSNVDQSHRQEVRHMGELQFKARRWGCSSGRRHECLFFERKRGK
jgi:hypothetical protein